MKTQHSQKLKKRKEKVLFSVNGLDTLVENHLIIYTSKGLFLGCVFSFIGQCVSLYASFDYYNFIVSFEISKRLSGLLFFIKICFGYSGVSLRFHIILR